jgi:hypothetical protein
LKKTVLALTLIVGLVLLAVIIQRVDLIKANPNFFKDNYCDMSIHSPQNMTYDTGNIILDFTAKTLDNIPPKYDYFYSLDGQDIESSVKIEDVQIVSEEEIANETIVPYTDTTLKGQAELPLFTNGSHSIRVFSGYFINGKIHYIAADHYSATVDFIVISGTATPSPEPTPYEESTSFPTSLVIAPVIAAAVVLIGLVLLLYGIKRK